MPEFDVTPEKRATQRAFLHRQLFVTPPLPTRQDANLEGKTVIVTGANTGIGLEVAKQILDLGASLLILAVRNEAKGAAAQKTLAAQSDTVKQKIEVWSLDLSSVDSITKFAERTSTLERLDIVINNAGLTKKSFTLNELTKHEETLQVNYISCVLLTILLLPVLQSKNSPENPGRLVLVNSEVASWPKFKERNSASLLTALDTESYFDSQDRYFTSKLLCQLFLSELAKRVPATVAVVNAPNPGLCSTSLQREHDGSVIGFVFGIIVKLLGRTAAIGARAITDAAVNHGTESHGQYLEDGKLRPLAPLVYKPEGVKLAQQLWKETMEDLEYAHVSRIIDGLKAT
jgi:NAD(P)-dependent dehydrogenase (short-subunit alcohol dehydrogenase family)